MKKKDFHHYTLDKSFFEGHERAVEIGKFLNVGINHYDSTRDLNKDKHILGKYGEIGFLHYLLGIGLEEKKDFYYPNILHLGKGDECDVILLPSGKKVDVKTHEAICGPFEDFLGNIKSESLVKPMDYYVFTWVMKDRSRLTVTGWCTREEFMDNSISHDIGERLTPSFVVLEPCNCISVGDLHPLYTLPEIARVESSNELAETYTPTPIHPLPAQRTMAGWFG